MWRVGRYLCSHGYFFDENCLCNGGAKRRLYFYDVTTNSLMSKGSMF